MRSTLEAETAEASRDGGGRVRRMIWRVANGLSLGGLCSWPLGGDWLQSPSLRLTLNGLRGGFRGARLVQISDLHCGPLMRECFLRRCVDEVNILRPDFVAITGDLVTVPQLRYARRVAKVLSGLTPSIATLAVLGNHDYGIWHPTMRGRLDAARDLTARLEDAGVIVLNNESRDFFRNGAAVQFVGTEDLWSRRYDPQRAFEKIRRGVPIVALVHNPDAAPDMAKRGAQWVLAGHTHAIPNRHSRLHGRLFPARHKHFVAGWYPLLRESNLYVNGGLGPARRLRSWQQPEVTLLILAPIQTPDARLAGSLERAGAGA